MTTESGTPSVDIAVDANTGWAIGIGKGRLALNDILRAAERLWTHPGFGRSRVLWDLRQATFPLEGAEVKDLANRTRTGSVLTSDAQMAFVVSGDLEFGLVRMFEALRAEPGLSTAVFRSYDEAVVWLAGDAPDASTPAPDP